MIVTKFHETRLTIDREISEKHANRFIKLKRYELVLIAHLHMRIVKIQRVGQSGRILPINVKEGDIRGKSTRFYILVSGRPRSRELRDLVSFQLDKTGPWLITFNVTLGIYRPYSIF